MNVGTYLIEYILLIRFRFVLILLNKVYIYVYVYSIYLFFLIQVINFPIKKKTNKKGYKKKLINKLSKINNWLTTAGGSRLILQYKTTLACTYIW